MTFQNENVARTILDVLRLDDKLTLGLARYLVNADRARRSGNDDAYQNQLLNIRELLSIPLDVSSDLEPEEINTWAERAARAAYDSGNYDWDWEDVLDFVLNVARENNEAVPEFTTAALRQYKHDYARHLRVLTQLPRLWEIRRREQMLDGNGKIESWATRNFYVLDSRTDVRGEGNTLDEAIKSALGSGEGQQ